jgi:FMN-dependent NADH-azoreductase
LKILHISCSPRGNDAESDRLARQIIGFLLRRDPMAEVIERAIGNGSLPHIDGDYALTQHSASAEVSEAGTIRISDELIRELEAADTLVIGTPMHNMSIPSTLKAWIDHVVRARRTFNVTRQGKTGVLRDRPVFVAVSSGGRFSGERANQPDFLTPYLKMVLGIMGLHDVTFFSVEGTGASEDAVTQARLRTDRLLDGYFRSDPRDRRTPSSTERSLSLATTAMMQLNSGAAA